MEGDLIVRIFIHGLLLLAPDHSSAKTGSGAVDWTTQVDTVTEVASMQVLLVDARVPMGDLEAHRPLLVHCETLNGDPCGDAVEIDLAEKGDFEELTISWVEARPESNITQDGVKLLPPVGRVYNRFPTPPAEDDGFGWVASLSEALGELEPLELTDDCRAPSPGPTCRIVARMTLTDGKVSTCSFIQEKVNKQVPVVAAHFVNPRGIDRAMADIILVELRRPLRQVKALKIERSNEPSLIIGPPDDGELCSEPGCVPDSCPGDDFCADLALTNLPPESKWSGKAEHFQALYKLVQQPPGVRLQPFPMVLRGAMRLPREEVQDRRCPMPDSFYDVAKFTTIKKGLFAALFGGGMQFDNIENRPICPPGTP